MYTNEAAEPDDSTERAISIRVKDGDMSSGGESSPLRLSKLYIQHVNDNTPAFEESAYSFGVFENADARTVVGRVVGTQIATQPSDRSLTTPSPRLPEAQLPVSTTRLISIEGRET